MTTDEPSPLSLPDVRRYLVGRFAGTLGIFIQSVAVGWQVYDLTLDPVSLGWVGFAQFLPMMLLTLPAGDLADRIDRRFLVAGAALLQALSAGVLAALTLAGNADVLPIYAALFLFGVGRAFSGPASRAFLPILVSTEQLPRAVALSSSTFQVAVIAGPALGGFLYVLGPEVVYALCLLLALVMSGSFFAIATRPTPDPRHADTTAWQRVTAGVAFLRRTPLVLGAVSLDLFAVLLGGATALLPVYARDILHVGPEGLGMLRAAPAIGALLVNLVLIYRPPRRRTGPLLFASIGVFGLATIVFGLSTEVWLSLTALLVMGGADMISVFVRSTLVPLATPKPMLGRVSAVEMLFIGASNELGELESGLTAGLFGTVPAVVIGGVGTLGVAGLWMVLFPDIRRIDKLSDVRPEGAT